MALASRGFSLEQFAEVGEILAEALAKDGEERDFSLTDRVAELTQRRPLYGYLNRGYEPSKG